MPLRIYIVKLDGTKSKPDKWNFGLWVIAEKTPKKARELVVSELAKPLHKDGGQFSLGYTYEKPFLETKEIGIASADTTGGIIDHIVYDS